LTLQSGICETRGFRSFISDTFRTHRAVRRRTVESFEEMAGFLRAYFMINRAAYRAMTVTIWEKRRWPPARIGRIVRVSMPPTAPRSGRVGGELRSRTNGGEGGAALKLAPTRRLVPVQRSHGRLSGMAVARQVSVAPLLTRGVASQHRTLVASRATGALREQ
jgi:hypothetical protein